MQAEHFRAIDPWEGLDEGDVVLHLMWNRGVGSGVLVIGGGGCLVGLVEIVHRLVATQAYFCGPPPPFTKLRWGASVCLVSCITRDALEGD